jgi:hypothetical protein
MNYLTMNNIFHRLLLSGIFTISLLNVHAQWTYACNDTLPYHNHQDGELMVQTSTNRLFSMQKEVGSNLYRIDYKENDVWNNVLTGTDGVDFSITNNEMYVLRKVSNAFVVEKYDLSYNLIWSNTSTLAPMTGQYLNAEMLHGNGDTLFIHFIDPGTANGGSVYQFDGVNWTDLNPGNFKRVKLDNSNRPVGLNVVSTFNPGNINYTFKKHNQVTSTWDVIGTVQDQHNFQDCDFIVAQNDSIYLNSLYYEGSTMLNIYAIGNGTTVVKDTMIFVVLEFVTSMKMVEDKMGDILLFYSNTELGPWGWAMCMKYRLNPQSAPVPWYLGMVSDDLNTEYVPMYPKITDAVVDEYNTYYTSYSYKTDWEWQPNDSTHTHVRKYLNCLYLANVNEVDTIGGQLVAHAGPIYNFQWIDCSTNTPILGATDSILSFPGNGMYAVVISNGECSDTSECFDLTHLAVEELNQQEISLYPNPSHDYVFVQNIKEGAEILVTDVYGRIVFSLKNGNTSESIQISEWNSGTYFITIGNDKFSSRGTFIKN